MEIHFLISVLISQIAVTREINKQDGVRSTMQYIFEFTRLAFTTLLILWPLSSWGEVPQITVVNGQFHTSSGLIPAGCLVQMKPQLNGDELIASVILEVEGKFGCKNAKHPYPEPLQDPEAAPPSYSILATLPEQVYRIKACEGVSGSMGKSCSEILIQFKERSFEGKNALVVIHRGRGSVLNSSLSSAYICSHSIL